MTTVQVYGEFHRAGLGSRGVVSRGIVQGLTAAGIECWCKNLSGPVLDPAGELQGCALPAGAHHGVCMPDAEVGLYVGGTPASIPSRLRMHRVKAALVVFETDLLPEGWVEALEQLDLVLVPSAFCAAALVNAGGPVGRIRVVPHGVDPAVFQPPAEPLAWVGHRFIHFAGGALDLIDRKGTLQLLRAFARVFGGGEHGLAELLVRVPLTARNEAGRQHPLAYNACVLDLVEELGLLAPGPARVVLEDACDPLTPEQVVDKLLGPPRVLIQPSRVEGFGLLPVQARALGLPIILSNCLGHLQHLDPEGDDVVVRVSRDGWGALRCDVPVLYEAWAPDVTVEDIEDALRVYLERAPELRRAAWARATGTHNHPRYVDRWSWESKTEFLAEVIKRGVG